MSLSVDAEPIGQLDEKTMTTHWDMKSLQYFTLCFIVFVFIGHVTARPEPYEASPLFGGFAVDSSEEEAGTGNAEQDRKMLTGELIRMERQLDTDIENNDHYEIRYALLNLELRLLPRMARLSREIDASLLNADQRAGERKFQKTLQQDIARMMYKAGARACLSPRETFYAPLNKCLPFGAGAGAGAGAQSSNPCKKKDQILYDGKNNEGSCDCVEDDRQLVYYDGECHRLNVRGPCSFGSWLVMTNSTPTCEILPANCTADGRHVYWSPDAVKVPAQCHTMGQRGPCGLGQIIIRDQTATLKCSFPADAPVAAVTSKSGPTGLTTPTPTTELVPASVWDRPSCSQGSFRSQNKRCAI